MSSILGWFGLDWTTLLGVVLGAVFEQVNAYLEKKRAEQALKELGHTQAEAEGQQRVSEIGGFQTERAVDQLTEDDVLSRLDGGTG